jgi:6-phosphogluconolactonase
MHLPAHIMLHRFPDRAAFARAMAEQAADAILADILRRGVASLAVSGGSTPAEFFRRLHAIDLPWERIVITLADDRWVPPTHADSTEKLVREELLHRSSPFLGLVNDAATPQAGEAAINDRLQALPLPLTLSCLGMGEDGHYASIFPHNASLAKAMDPANLLLCTAVSDAPKPPPQRITLTLPTLMNTGRVILHLIGQSKLDALDTALADGPVEAMPIRAILRQTDVPVEIFYAD